jgi:hypothetical protein
MTMVEGLVFLHLGFNFRMVTPEPLPYHTGLVERLPVTSRPTFAELRYVYDIFLGG